MPEVRQVLPRGRHAAPRAVVERSQRERLLEAMAAAVAEKGLAQTSVADVLARARVSRKSFYELFDNKLACFLAAYDLMVERLLEAIEAARAPEAEPFAAAAAGTRAYLGYLADHPAFARAFLVEILGAGPEALARRSAAHERFADVLEGFHEQARAALGEPEPLPRHRFLAAVGAVNELVCEELRRDGPAGLPGLAPVVFDVQVALLVGPDAAPPAG